MKKRRPGFHSSYFIIYFKNDVLLRIACGMNEHISVEVVDKLDDLFNEIGLEGIRTLIYDLLSGKGYGPRTFIESSNNYLSEMFKAHNVEIIVVKDINEEKDVKEELVEDMMSLIASFSGKLYGMRSKTNKGRK